MVTSASLARALQPSLKPDAISRCTQALMCHAGLILIAQPLTAGSVQQPPQSPIRALHVLIGRDLEYRSSDGCRQNHKYFSKKRDQQQRTPYVARECRFSSLRPQKLARSRPVDHLHLFEAAASLRKLLFFANTSSSQ